MLDELTLFRQVGQVCLEQGLDGRMALKRIVEILDEPDTTLRGRMAAVSKFFHKYFAEYENLQVPEDKVDMPPAPAERLKLFERSSGKTFRIYPLGFRAWQLTCRYLDRIALLRQQAT